MWSATHQHKVQADLLETWSWTHNLNYTMQRGDGYTTWRVTHRWSNDARTYEQQRRWEEVWKLGMWTESLMFKKKIRHKLNMLHHWRTKLKNKGLERNNKYKHCLSATTWSAVKRGGWTFEQQGQKSKSSNSTGLAILALFLAGYKWRNKKTAAKLLVGRFKASDIL